METILSPYNDYSDPRSAMRDLETLRKVLSSRGESYAGTIDGVERWTRTYASKRKSNGDLIIIPISKQSWYYIISNEKVNKLFIWVGSTLQTAGKLNTSGFREMISEGDALIEEVV